MLPHLLLSSEPPLDVDDHHYHLDLDNLLTSELDRHHHSPNYLRRLRDSSLDPDARLDAVDWILKVGGFYGFRRVTSYLAVEYMDRFLSDRVLPSGGWAWQLLAVASLSVAAKMEEREVPLLADLQVMDPKCAFEARTVMRMELLLMAALGWRMRAVTPFDYLDLLARPVAGHAGHRALLSRASDLVVGTRRVVDFLRYRPPAIAVAALLCAESEIGTYSDFAQKYSAKFNEAINKGDTMNKDCYQLMKARLVGESPSAPSCELKATTAEPQSPAGVLDIAACRGCDTNNRLSVHEAHDPKPEPASERSSTSKRRRVDFRDSTEGLYIVEDEGRTYH